MIMIVSDILLNICTYLDRRTIAEVINEAKLTNYNFNKQQLYSLKCSAENICLPSQIDSETYYEETTFNRSANLYDRNNNLIMKNVTSLVSLDDDTILFSVSNTIYKYSTLYKRIPRKILTHSLNILLIFNQGLYTYFIDEGMCLYCFKYSSKQAIFLHKLSNDELKTRSAQLSDNRLKPIIIKSSYVLKDEKVYNDLGNYYLK